LKTLKYRGSYPPGFDGQFEKAWALRFFVHLVGDLHQPLHVTSRCTKAMPECDAGGNLFPLTGTPNELHALWDEAMTYLKPDGGRVNLSVKMIFSLLIRRKLLIY
jgi:hypothetical protein